MARRKSGLDFTRRRETKKLNIPLIREIVVFGIEIAIAVGLGFVLVYFLGLRTTVIGRAMEETLYASDEIMIDRFRYGNGDFPLISDPGVAEEPVRLGTDEYFVLGDNTNESEDSRFADIGNVSKEFIIGKAWYVLHSEHHKGFIH